jgi:hypothetical protein
VGPLGGLLYGAGRVLGTEGVASGGGLLLVAFTVCFAGPEAVAVVSAGACGVRAFGTEPASSGDGDRAQQRIVLRSFRSLGPGSFGIVSVDAWGAVCKNKEVFVMDRAD